MSASLPYSFILMGSLPPSLLGGACKKVFFSSLSINLTAGIHGELPPSPVHKQAPYSAPAFNSGKSEAPPCLPFLPFFGTMQAAISSCSTSAGIPTIFTFSTQSNCRITCSISGRNILSRPDNHFFQSPVTWSSPPLIHSTDIPCSQPSILCKSAAVSFWKIVIAGHDISNF